MSDRSGCGPIELTVLDVVNAASGHSGKYRVSTVAVAEIEARTGLGPRYGYDVLVDLARPWVIPVPLIDIQGNIGDQVYGHDASAPRYTESRPSHVGRLVLDAEAGRVAPVPVGLINGTTYRGGQQPPLEPSRVVAALRRLLDDPRVPDPEVLDLVGPPHSTAGCELTGDLEALMNGHPAAIHETGRVTVTDVAVPVASAEPPAPARPDGLRVVVGYAGADAAAFSHPIHLIIESLPVRSNLSDVGKEIGARIGDPDCPGPAPDRPWDGSLPVEHIADLSSDRDGIRIVMSLRPGADAALVRDHLAAIEGITAETTWAFPAPLATLLRTWADHHSNEDIASSLTRLEEAIHRDQRRWHNGT